MTLRPPRDDEFDAMLELMNAHQLAAFGEADYTADDLRTWLTTPYVDVERDIRVLERDGRLIAYADADPTRDDPPLWWCDVKVAPGADAAEVVPELVAWLEQRAKEGRLRVWTSETDARIVGAFGVAGYVALLGVRRPWRRQGLGEALLLHSFEAFRRKGFTRGTLGVDASSVTGATRLYERAGMRVYRDTVFLERPVRR